MTDDAATGREHPESCANCGAAMRGPYCAACGQSGLELKRPFFSLIGEIAGDVFSLDGRLWRTARNLYRQPGRVARDYVDGRRASYTPPVRLFLLVSLVFFGAMALAGARIISVQPQPVVNDGDTQQLAFEMEVLRFGPGVSEVELSDEERDELREVAEGESSRALMARMQLAAVDDPARVERGASAAAAQAIFVMVAAFALFNAVLHPRGRVIGHAIHSLYFHAAFLPAFGLAAALVEAAGVWPPLETPAGVLLLLATFTGMMLFDRGFYGSSWLGAVLRTLVVIPLYAVTAGILAAVLAFSQII